MHNDELDATDEAYINDAISKTQYEEIRANEAEA